MTEVALALAMGFFSILVLTLVSIGGGSKETPSYEAIHVVETAPESASTVLPTAGKSPLVLSGLPSRVTCAISFLLLGAVRPISAPV